MRMVTTDVRKRRCWEGETGHERERRKRVRTEYKGQQVSDLTGAQGGSGGGIREDDKRYKGTVGGWTLGENATKRPAEKRIKGSGAKKMKRLAERSVGSGTAGMIGLVDTNNYLHVYIRLANNCRPLSCPVLSCPVPFCPILSHLVTSSQSHLTARNPEYQTAAPC